MDKLLLLIVLSDMRNALRTADVMNFCVYPGVPDPVLITRLCTFPPTLLTYFYQQSANIMHSMNVNSFSHSLSHRLT